VPSHQDIVQRAYALLGVQDVSDLRPLYNLTGIILHINFGRTVLAEADSPPESSGLWHLRRHPGCLSEGGGVVCLA
jgi:hypothetical protein